MFNKWLSLHDKINDLEVENARLRQTIHFKNRKIDQAEKVHDLEAEITYWKETAEFWKKTSKFWKETAEAYQKELNKTLDKEKAK